MLRGNHECRHLTEYFTFKEECTHKYNINVYNSIMEVFDALPLAAIMNNQFFCVHGGLSPELHSLEDIDGIERYVEPSSKGLMTDLLWADPCEDFSPSNSVEYELNETRGTSYSFGYKATVEFLNKHRLLSVIRAHEAQEVGYRMYTKNSKTGFPALITLFSAPNYLTHYNNKAAIMKYENNSMTIKQFTESPHPYFLPSFMNAFDWSIPFVAEKLGEMLLVVLHLVNDEAVEEQQETERKKMEVLRRKVAVVGKMVNMFKSIRAERELAVTLNGLTIREQKIPETTILQGKSSKEIRAHLSTFDGTKQIDAANETLPGGIEKVEKAPSITHFKRIQSKEAIKAMKNGVGSASGSPLSSPRGSPRGSPNLSPRSLSPIREVLNQEVVPVITL
eukprot:TRINITY_DN14083_c0_g6_i1.p1 TRINITY_DN14083_c0_g6~~TRINITY_DN14083_c0_g6_i1.p1  ORF type:complete len:392 (-),score=79.71 TRINITY_DN14083_c0_g6_i1:259-1434(-)